MRLSASVTGPLSNVSGICSTVRLSNTVRGVSSFANWDAYRRLSKELLVKRYWPLAGFVAMAGWTRFNTAGGEVRLII